VPGAGEGGVPEVGAGAAAGALPSATASELEPPPLPPPQAAINAAMLTNAAALRQVGVGKGGVKKVFVVMVYLLSTETFFVTVSLTVLTRCVRCAVPALGGLQAPNAERGFNSRTQDQRA
jgi:hypothetical protein